MGNEVEENYHKSRDRVVEERNNMIVPEEVLNRRSQAKRRNTGITQEELAELSGVSPSTIQNIEQGFRTDKGVKSLVHLTAKTAKKLAPVFGVRIEYLLGEDDYRTEAQYRISQQITASLDESSKMAEYKKTFFHSVIQSFLRQGENKGAYSFEIRSSPDGESLNYVVGNGVVSTVLDDGYLTELREDVLAYFNFKMNRYINSALIAEMNQFFQRATR